MAKLDPLSEKIRQSLINYNPFYEAQFSAMNKSQLRNEVKRLVDGLIKDNEECVRMGLKKFSSKFELVQASAAEICNEVLHISIAEYNNFM